MPTQSRWLRALLLSLLVASVSMPIAARAQDELAARESAVDAELATLQRRSRRYLYGWLSADIVFAGAQLGVAVSTDEPAVRASYYLGTGLAFAGITVLALQPWPAVNGLRKYRARPASTPDQLRDKITYGEGLIAHQRERDRLARRWDKHLIAGVVSVASGLEIGLGYSDLPEGLIRGASLLLIMELQILTRARPPKATSERAFHVGPWIDQYVQGIALHARY